MNHDTFPIMYLGLYYTKACTMSSLYIGLIHVAKSTPHSEIIVNKLDPTI